MERVVTPAGRHGSPLAWSKLRVGERVCAVKTLLRGRARALFFLLCRVCVCVRGVFYTTTDSFIGCVGGEHYGKGNAHADTRELLAVPEGPIR